MNICGCLVHVAKARAASARAAIEATEGAEIHAASEDDRFVVVVEDTATRMASEIIMDMHQIPGVVSLTLTYHHFEDVRRQGVHPAVLSQPQSTTKTGGPIHDHQ